MYMHDGSLGSDGSEVLLRRSVSIPVRLVGLSVSKLWTTLTEKPATVRLSTGAAQGLSGGYLCGRVRGVPALLLVLVLLLAGWAPGAGRGAHDGAPTADAPFTLTALDVGQPTFLFRGQNIRVMRFWQQQRAA
jgi:hypothetical protein